MERFKDYECGEGENKIELFGKVLAAVIIDDRPVEDYVGEGEDRLGEGKHF